MPAVAAPDRPSPSGWVLAEPRPRGGDGPRGRLTSARPRDARTTRRRCGAGDPPRAPARGIDGHVVPVATPALLGSRSTRDPRGGTPARAWSGGRAAVRGSPPSAPPNRIP